MCFLQQSPIKKKKNNKNLHTTSPKEGSREYVTQKEGDQGKRKFAFPGFDL